VGEEERFEGTLLRLDIADFSSRPDRLARGTGRGLERDAAEDLAAAVEEAFRPIFYAVDRHGGSIASLEGDAVLALFRGPLHPYRAARSLEDILQVRPGLHAASASGDVRSLQLGGAEQRAELLHGAALRALEQLEGNASAAVAPQDGEESPARAFVPPDDAELLKFVPPALRDLPPQPPVHRRVVAVFVAAARTAASAVFRTLAEEAETHHVLLLKVRAERDEIVALALAGAPVAAEDDARRAIAFAVACRNRLVDTHGVRARFGLAEGPVLSLVLGDGSRLSWDVIGDSVNVSYRLLGEAGPTEVLATSALVEAARGVLAGPVETVQLRGKTRPTAIQRVTGVLAPARHTPDPAYPRRRALTRIDAALDSGQAVAIVGAAGQGKRYLWQEWAARNPTWRVLRATCRNHGAVRPLAPFTGTVRRLGGEAATQQALQAALRALPEMDDRATAVLIGFVASGAPQLAAVVAAVRQLLAGLAQASPTLLVFEDHQWADDDTAALLARLLQDAPRTGLRVLVTARPRSPLPAGVPVVELGPLSPEEAGMLVRPRLGEQPDEAIVAEIVRRGNGIPRELVALADAVRRGQHDLPDSMEAWYAARLDGLDPSAREVLERAAILGRTLNQGLLRRLSADVPRADEGLQALYDQRLLVADDLGTRVAFDREATREIAYMRMTSARRRQLHTRVGRVLQARAASGAPVAPEVLAWHLSRSDAPAEAVGPLVEASRRALAHGRPKLALSHSEQAARIARQHDRGALPRVQRALGDAMLALGRADLALEAFRNVGDDALSVEVAAALVAAGFAREALEAVGQQTTAMAAVVRARALSLLGDPRAAEAHAVALAAAGRPEEHARALRFYGADLLRNDRFTDALDVLREAVLAAVQVGDPTGRADALDLLGGAQALVGQLDAALSSHRTALSLREVHGQPEGVAGTLRRLGRAESRSVHGGRALGHLVAARALMRDAGLASRLGRVEVDLAEVRWRRGERDHAQRHLLAATDLNGRSRARHALLTALLAEPANRPVATARAVEVCDLDRWRSGSLFASAYAAWQQGDDTLLAAAEADLAQLRHAEFTAIVAGWRERPPHAGVEDVVAPPLEGPRDQG
jgi:class 3 adenylate cyclase/tetratricopeptide (TPR) repeat protein